MCAYTDNNIYYDMLASTHIFPRSPRPPPNAPHPHPTPTRTHLLALRALGNYIAAAEEEAREQESRELTLTLTRPDQLSSRKPYYLLELSY